ncbi:MAG: hypothetical protein COV52_02765 [Gammaproteobacteria bacterium CG11_big_fil_rev_8_21_14_0_20_46_22]|nr:MAG: hypothetical protein COW05_08800 [Gammaproteobacteria bacterium CG12_big_fil_rev_8_21_14_0_65_46_12]PIR11699.1 MAG: hypothetical protein COV52_02765 [Gammaproteobacteria bacterium CG11_big_fil_rev_8_21_14_0_20_46_22]
MSPNLPRWDGEPRPPLITIVTWLGLFFNAFWIYAAFVVPANEEQGLAPFGLLFTPAAILESILMIIALFFIFRMQRIGVWLFLLIAVLYNAYVFYFSALPLVSIVIDAVMFVIFLLYTPQMS